MSDSTKKEKPTFRSMLVKAGGAIKETVGKINRSHVKSMVRMVAPYAVKEIKHGIRSLIPRPR